MESALLWTLYFFYGMRKTQGYQLDHSLSQRLLKHFFYNVLLENVGLTHVLQLTAHRTWTRACQLNRLPEREHMHADVRKKRLNPTFVIIGMY